MSNINRKDSRLIPKILLSKPIECEEKHLPIHPYVFGVWLGDGNNADGKVAPQDVWDVLETQNPSLEVTVDEAVNTDIKK